MLCMCLVPCVFIGKECLQLLMCVVSDDRHTGVSAVRWLFGCSVVGLSVALLVPLFFVVLGDARPFKVVAFSVQHTELASAQWIGLLCLCNYVG